MKKILIIGATSGIGMGGVGVLVYNSGVGIYDKKLDFVPEKGTIPVNVTGFVDTPMTKQNK